MSLLTFNKTGYRSSAEIDKLYDHKIALLINGRSVDELSKRDSLILEKLKQSRYYDPRHLEVCFGLSEEVDKAIVIANNLDSISDEEFMISSYPYEWLEQLSTAICRLTGDEAVNILKKELGISN